MRFIRKEEIEARNKEMEQWVELAMATVRSEGEQLVDWLDGSVGFLSRKQSKGTVAGAVVPIAEALQVVNPQDSFVVEWKFDGDLRITDVLNKTIYRLYDKARQEFPRKPAPVLSPEELEPY